MTTPLPSRRDLLRQGGAFLAASALAPASLIAAPKGKATSCILLWLGGGSAHLDTFDPKVRGDGKKKAGSYYDAIPTAIPGSAVCEHLPRVARKLDRCVLVRTLHHKIIDEHAAATNIVHTGRATSGTIIYPSIGSVVSHELGPGGDGVPAYVVIGYPNVTRGPGFLGAKYGYVYLTETSAGPAGLTPPADLVASRKARRESLLESIRGDFEIDHPADPAVANYVAASREATRLAGPAFASVFRLEDEPGSRRASYGGEFGQRCLLARRLVESGVRFVTVNSGGWDHHANIFASLDKRLPEIDGCLSSLIEDLDSRGLLDSTLVLCMGEFGRSPKVNNMAGRDHWGHVASLMWAGGGVKGGRVIGASDDQGAYVSDRPIRPSDVAATIYQAVGVDPTRNLVTPENRPVAILDEGSPVGELFA